MFPPEVFAVAQSIFLAKYKVGEVDYSAIMVEETYHQETRIVFAHDEKDARKKIKQYYKDLSKDDMQYSAYNITIYKTII